MPISITPFVNPFRKKAESNDPRVVVVERHGKQYKKIVRK